MASKKTDLTSQLQKLQALREKVRLTEEAQVRQTQLRKESEGVAEKLVAENTKINAKLSEKKEALKRYQLIVDHLIFQKNQLQAKLLKLQQSLEEEQLSDDVQSQLNIKSKTTQQHAQPQQQHAQPQQQPAPPTKYQQSKPEQQQFKQSPSLATATAQAQETATSTTSTTSTTNNSNSTNIQPSFDRTFSVPNETVTRLNEWKPKLSQSVDNEPSAIVDQTPKTSFNYKHEPARETTSDDFKFKADEIWELRKSIEEIESQLQKTLELQKQCE